VEAGALCATRLLATMFQKNGWKEKVVRHDAIDKKLIIRELNVTGTTSVCRQTEILKM
jgi:hypothetical protein